MTGSLGAHDSEAVWDRHAGWWQQGFTNGADPEYAEQVLPLLDEHLGDAARVLEVGCGEGQVARHMARRGVEVVGLDPVAAHIVEAHRRGGAHYIRSRGQAIALGDATVDTAVLCLVLEHLDPFEPVLAEIARVLRPGGRLLVVMNHPLVQVPGACWVDDADLGDQYWRIGPYLDEQVVVEEVSPGVEIPFAYRPLGRYVRALGRVGLPLEDLVEPPPSPSTMRHLAGFAAAASIPRLALLVARRSPGPACAGRQAAPSAPSDDSPGAPSSTCREPTPEGSRHADP